MINNIDNSNNKNSINQAIKSYTELIRQEDERFTRGAAAGALSHILPQEIPYYYISKHLSAQDGQTLAVTCSAANDIANGEVGIRKSEQLLNKVSDSFSSKYENNEKSYVDRVSQQNQGIGCIIL